MQSAYKWYVDVLVNDRFADYCQCRLVAHCPSPLPIPMPMPINRRINHADIDADAD